MSPDSTKQSPDTQLPRSKMARPSNLMHWPQFAFWRLATPLHPYVRNVSAKLGLIDFNQFLDQKGRQRFLIGTINPERSTESLIAHLISQGYGDNVLAWSDTGELASLRLSDGFRYQYHVRIFDDGEIRGHYEYTPEAHPLKHYYEVDMLPRRDYFLEILGDFVIPS